MTTGDELAGEGGGSGTEAIARAADVLRKSGDGPYRMMYLLACMEFDFEAFADASNTIGKLSLENL